MIDHAPPPHARQWIEHLYATAADEGANTRTFRIANVNGYQVGVVQFQRLQGSSVVTCGAVDWSLCDKSVRWQLGQSGAKDETAAMHDVRIRDVLIRNYGRPWDDQLRAAGYTVSAAAPLRLVR
jgi:hypothetical protein